MCGTKVRTVQLRVLLLSPIVGVHEKVSEALIAVAT